MSGKDIEVPQQSEPEPSLAPEQTPAAGTPAAVEGKGEGAVEATPQAPEQAPSPPASSAADEEPKEAQKETAPKEDWRDRRIAKLTAQLKQLREERTPAAPPPVENETDIEARVAQEVALRAFNEACNKVAAEGSQQFPDFTQRVDEIRKLVDGNDPTEVGQYHLLLQAAIDTGAGATVLHQLGGDPNEAARIMGLSPTRMGIELARLASKTPEEVTKAPRPINPIGNRGAAHTAIDPTDTERADNLSTADWMRRRNEQIAARFAAENGRR